MARHLGQSLYTWTSVIGVVLAGIAAGNVAGGRIADRFEPRSALARTFVVSSLLCLLVPALFNTVIRWASLWDLSWALRTFLQALAVFLLPAAALGAISPMAARMALEMENRAGRTLGGLYAWGAAGSLAGTFLAGFWLVAAIGAGGVIVLSGALLGTAAVLLQPRPWTSRVGLAVSLAAAFAAFGPGAAATRLGVTCGFRDKPGDGILYRDESQYSYIAVKAMDAKGRVRGLYLDKMLHSEIDTADPTNLLYKYAWVYEAVLDQFAEPGRPISAFVIGGGAYTFPQYIALTRPGSRVDVAEIDPAVTRAAQAACGFSSNATVTIHHTDARTYVADLVRRKNRGETVPAYDFVFGDTFNDYSVPYQLTTDEFNRELSELMTDRGMYLLNMIDRFDSGRFLGSVVRTYRRTFRDVQVVFCHPNLVARGTYVVVASKRPVDLGDVEARIRTRHDFRGARLSVETVDELASRPGTVVLTDDFAPVENLLAEVVRRNRPEGLDVQYLKRGLAASGAGDLGKAMRHFERALEINPGNAQVHFNLGVAMAQAGQTEDALRAFAAALEIAPDYVEPRNNAAVILAEMGMTDAAIAQFEEVVRRSPDNVDGRINLASLLAQRGQLDESVTLLTEAIRLRPGHAIAHNNLGEILAARGEVEAAVGQFTEALRYDPLLDAAKRNLARWGK